MSLYIDPNVVQADIDRRYELAGVDRNPRHHREAHRRDLPARPLPVHPLAAFVARLVGGGSRGTAGGSSRAARTVTGRPLHP